MRQGGEAGRSGRGHDGLFGHGLEDVWLAAPATKETTLLLLGRRLRGALPGLLAPTLLALFNVPPAGAAAAQAQLDEPRNDGRRGGGPHHGEHGHADIGANVDRGVCLKHVAHDDEEDGGDDGGDGDAEGGEEGEDHDKQREPAAVDGRQLYGDHDGGEAGRGEEEAEHEVGDGPDAVSYTHLTLPTKRIV